MSARKNKITFHLSSGAEVTLDGNYAAYVDVRKVWGEGVSNGRANLVYTTSNGESVSASMDKLEAVSFR